MDYENFLANCTDNNVRNKLWELFKISEPEAKWFGSLHNNWVEIVSVEHHPKDAVWSSNGKILIPAFPNNLGALFHETFHSAFHQSPLWHNRLNNVGGDSWGEGFCNAFRWFMETQLLKTSHWLDTFTKTKKSSKILKKCDWNYQKFKDLWVYLNQNSDTILDSFFS